MNMNIEIEYMEFRDRMYGMLGSIFPIFECIWNRMMEQPGLGGEGH